MTKQSSLLAALSVLLASVGTPAVAASETGDSVAGPGAGNEEKTISLAPFKITAEKATGYAVHDASSSSRMNLPYVDVPQTITVMTNELLGDLNISVSRQAIEWGQNIMAGTNGSNNGGYFIRGLTITQAYRDGFLTTTNAIERDAALYDRIEIVSGPASAAIGRGQAGGLINYVTKKPFDKNAAKLSLTVATDNYYRFEYDYNRVLKAGAFRVPVFYEDGDGTYGGEFNGLKKFGAAPSFLWNISGNSQLLVNATGWKTYGPGLASESDYLDKTGTLFRLRQSIGQYVGSPWNPFQFPLPSPDQQTWGYPGIGRLANVGEFSAIFTSKLTDWAELRLGLFADGMQDTFRYIGKAAQTLPDPTNPNNFLQPLTFLVSYGSAMQARNQGDLLVTKTLFGIKHSVDVGYDAFALRTGAKSGSITSYKGVALVDQLYNPTHVPPPGFDVYSAAPVTAKSVTRQKGVGYYIQYLGSAWNDHILLMAGVRQDRTDTQTFNVVKQTYVLDQVQTTRAPRYSVTYKPVKTMSVYYLRSYQEDPPVTQLKYTNYQATGGAVPPPPGDPRYSTYIVGQLTAKLDEVGIKYSFLNDHLIATAAYYKLVQDGAIATTPVNDTSQATPQNPQAQLHWTEAYLTTGSVYKGYEFSLTGQINKRLTFTALYCIPQGQTLFQGVLAPAPRVIRAAKLFGKYSLPLNESSGLEFSGGIRVLFGNWTIRSNSAVKMMNDQEGVQAGVSYYWKKREYEIRLFGSNLTNDPQFDGTGNNAELRRYYLTFTKSI